MASPTSRAHDDYVNIRPVALGVNGEPQRVHDVLYRDQSTDRERHGRYAKEYQDRPASHLSECRHGREDGGFSIHYRSLAASVRYDGTAWKTLPTLRR